MISVCMLTKNAGRSIAKTLDSTCFFVEVLLLDNGSMDDTLTIARTYPNVRIETSPFIGFGPLRNKAAAQARYDWILALDSDEILSPSLIKELSSLKLDSDYVYEIPRHNFYNGKQIKGSGWHPEWVVRLYHREKTTYSDSAVHESVVADRTKTIRLKHPILHTPYLTTSDFLAKMQHYSSLFAEQNRGKKKSSFFKAASHAFFAFFKSYLLQRGILDGREGFIISLYNANTAFYKYLKLAEENRWVT